MTMQTASTNSPLHLQPIDRPKATPASANQRCGRVFAEAVHERRDREQAEGERKNIQHRDPRLHEQHLVEEGEQAAAMAGPCAANNARPHRYTATMASDPNSTRRIAPAQRPVAERTDRQRDELFRQRRMHRVEHRLRHHGLEHLPRRRHVMHLVEIEFLRRGDADQHREMRENKDNSRDDGAAHHRLRGTECDWALSSRTTVALSRTRRHCGEIECERLQIFMSIALNAFRFRRH